MKVSVPRLGEAHGDVARGSRRVEDGSRYQIDASDILRLEVDGRNLPS